MQIDLTTSEGNGAEDSLLQPALKQQLWITTSGW